MRRVKWSAGRGGRPEAIPAVVSPGIEVLLSGPPYLDLVRDKRVGLITNPTGIDSRLHSTVDLLHKHPEVRLVALFGPEHGVRGEAQAGEKVADRMDARTGCPVYSLYGETRKPTPRMLEGVEVLVYDIQDGVCRYYTYQYSMALAMEAAAEAGIPFVVLDRPHPLGGHRVEGNVLDPAYSSFVGRYPTPIQPGMTAGELARLFNVHFGIGAQLHVVPMEGWRRGMWFDETGLPWVAPSPNLPTLDSVALYPGTCLVEGTNLSEGRGTTQPFEVVGAPWVDGFVLARYLNRLELPGVGFRPVHFVPMASKHKGEPCSGVQLHVFDREALRPVETALHLLAAVKALFGKHFAWLEPPKAGGHRFFDLLAGGAELRLALDAGQPVAEIVAGWEEQLRAFAPVREKYLLYP